YPSVADAQGLCFSAHRSAAPPASLVNIMGCLENHGLIESTTCPDLRSWAAQGVLMVNAAYTLKVGEKKGHQQIWKLFAKDLLTNFCRIRSQAPHPTYYLLWGAEAERAFMPAVARQVIAA